MGTNNNNDLFEDLQKSADRVLGHGMLSSLVKESKDVLGDLADLLLSDEVSITDKYRAIQEIELIAMAERVKAFNYETTNELALQASSALLAVAKTVKTTLRDKHSIETVEVVDFSNPKINRGMGFLVELIMKVLSDQEDIKEETLVKVMESFSTATIDLESKLNEAFYGVPISKVEEVINPLITEQKKGEMEFIPLFDVGGTGEEVKEDKPKRKRRKRRTSRRRVKNERKPKKS